MIAPFLIFLSFLAVYARGISSSVFAGDNGDIVMSYYFAGVPHPPGYPLNTILGWLITRIPVGATFAFRANFVSAVYCALTISLLYVFLFKVTKDRLASIVGASVLAFVPLFWLYAHIAEVFQLTLILLLGSLYFLFSWLSFDLKKQKNYIKYLYFSIAFLSTAIFHHQTAILLMPAYCYIFFKKRIVIFNSAKKFIYFIVAVFVGFLPYLYIPIAAHRKTPLNWDDATNLTNFIRLITRADYGTFQASVDILGFSYKARLVQVVWYWKVLLADFSVLGIFLIVLGLLYLYKRNSTFFFFIALNLFFTGPFFLFYASFPLLSVFSEGINERFLLTHYLFLGICLALGIFCATKFVGRFFQKYISHKEAAQLFVTLSFGLIPFSFFLINYPKADLSKSDEGGYLAKDILNSSNPPGILFLAGDTVGFNTEYEYYVEHVNPETILIGSGKLRGLGYRESIKKSYPSLQLPDDFLTDNYNDPTKSVLYIIYNNKDKFPIYSVFEIPVAGDYEWVQQGFVEQLYKKDDKPNANDLAESINKRIREANYSEEKTKKNYVNLFTEHIINIYSDFFASNASVMMDLGKYDEAQMLYLRALDNNSENMRAILGLGMLKSKMNSCEAAEDIYLGAVEKFKNNWEPLQSLSVLYKDCFHDNAKADEFTKKAEKLFTPELAKPIDH